MYWACKELYIEHLTSPIDLKVEHTNEYAKDTLHAHTHFKYRSRSLINLQDKSSEEAQADTQRMYKHMLS